MARVSYETHNVNIEQPHNVRTLSALIAFVVLVRIEIAAEDF